MGPQAVDRDRRSIGGVELAPLLQLAVALETLQVERVDVAVAEIPDEQVSAELPEIGGGHGQPPPGTWGGARLPPRAARACPWSPPALHGGCGARERGLSAA